MLDSRKDRMGIGVIGAGLPRTGTSSLGVALQQLLGGPSYSMSSIPGHPFDLGTGWERVFRGQPVDWGQVFNGYVAALDWPASMFWRELSEAYPEALVILSTRDNPEVWWQSADATFLPFARLALAPDWNHGTGLTDLLERFAGIKDWNDPVTLMSAYERHNAEVRKSVPSHRLLEWNPSQGWEPICQLLHLPVPDMPFPWVNKRSDWG